MSVPEEGYIKFEVDWKETKIVPINGWEELNEYRTRLFDRGLIGKYENGIGFGNVSMRLDRKSRFIISGTQTGRKRILEIDDYSRVVNFNIERNKVWCEGRIKASSESLTHAAIYQALPKICFVFHIHELSIWQQWKDKLPTTDGNIPYGTPAMALEIQGTIRDAPNKPIIMGGHREGIVLIGATAYSAYRQLNQL